MQPQPTTQGTRPAPPSRYANTGGPASRTRKERVESSLLGRNDGEIRCQKIIQLGLDFEDAPDPLAVLERLLTEQGCQRPDDLRGRICVPLKRLLCRTCPVREEAVAVPPQIPFSWPEYGLIRHGRLVVAHSPPLAVLEQALMLGLCTAQLYDPSRPVLWTRASVTRALELFDPSGFYS